ncbi:hypothetical protein EST38_g2893 [Candolleomyces aberdarensis]|uniref:U3 small nucleolar ribonucleoprotein protein MPP10 n=1 Tax=Candolleomyces aberdarensis TaxID=2316362 RepID=A0A4Q2DUG2_9AGAR|nr:hypothetical protein EST38_g2893 [Candolleomyces aberdarensis]
MASEIGLPTVPQLSALSKAVECPEKLASGSQEIQNFALDAAKFIFDLSLKSEESSLKHVNELISSITPSQAPQTRAQTRQAAARPAVPPPSKSLFKQTPLTSLFTENLDEDQIWAQLDIRTKHMCEVLEVVLEGELPEDEDAEALDRAELVRALEEEEDSFDEDEDSYEEEEEGSMDDSSDDESDEEGDFHGFGSGEEEGVMDLDDGSSDEDNSHSEDGDSDENMSEEGTLVRTVPRKRKRGVTSELDDGFFDLSSFKAEIEQAEARSSSRGHLADEDDSDDEPDSVDLFAPVENSADGEEDDQAKELFYRDFFEAPRKPPVKQQKSSKDDSSRVRFHDEVKVKQIKRAGKGRSLQEEEDGHGEFISEDETESDDDEQSDEDGEDSDMQSEGEEYSDASDAYDGRETMERIKDDLFADEEDDTQKDMTTHEKRMAALKDQISDLEQENVSKKNWTLMGEADARTRPQNSLLEEDLEFERVMKPTPVITEEVVHSLEELIKSRILENRFDDVIRIRPVDDKPFLPSRLLELKDTKSTQSLAQIYENEYMATQDGGPVLDDRDGKLKKEHEEIEAQWEKICAKLDALSNAHFVPKQPKSLISTVSNVSTASMESALPTTKSATSMLAPEEIFSAENSQPRARTELTPGEKRTVRAKERKAKRKQRDLLEKTVDKAAKSRGSVKKQKQAALESLVKHGKGVTVVGKAAKDLKSKRTKRS